MGCLNNINIVERGVEHHNPNHQGALNTIALTLKCVKMKHVSLFHRIFLMRGI
jgi:hypothetical protein